MGERNSRKPIQLVVEGGTPSGVIVDIEEYQEMLERLEDAEDLKHLEEMRKGALKFRKLEEFMAEYSPNA